LGQGLETALKAIQPQAPASPQQDAPPSSNPLEAPGFPPATGTRPLPAPQTGPPDPNQFLLRAADRFSRSGDRLIGQGNIRFTYKGYDVTADRLDGNLQTEIFLLQGNVLIVGDEQLIRGEEVLVNFKESTFRFTQGQAQIGPSKSGGNLLGDLYIKGSGGAGTEQEQEYERSTFTTCDHDPPHYFVDARRTTLRPGKRAIFRDVKIIVLNRTLLTIPFLVVPLERYSDRYTPEVGKTETEGYFVKVNLFTPLRGNGYIANHLDYYTKIGFGLGQDFHYQNRTLQGVFRYYTVTGTQTFLSGINHRQNIFGGQFSMDGNFQNNNYLTAPGASQMNVRAQFVLPQSSNNTRFSYYRTMNRSSNFRFEQENIGLSDQRNWDASLSSQVDLNLVQVTNGRAGQETIKRSEFDISVRATKEFPQLSAEFEYTRNVPILADESFFSGSDRTPFVTLRTSSLKAFGQKFAAMMPMRMMLAFGELQESQEVGRIRRTYFDIDYQKSFNFKQRHFVNVGSRYRQGIYSDDTAGYALNFTFDYRYTLGHDTAFNLRYGYLRPYGFSPLQMDQVGRFHNFTADLSVRPIRSLLLSAQTGFDVLQLDLRQTPWQTIGVTGTWQPNPRFQLRGYTNYDTFSHAWSNVRLDMGWYTARGLLSIGTRYDGIRHTWSTFNLFADGLVWKKLRTSAILAYNGYTKRFDSQQVSFTYDLHCAELIFQVINNPTGFRSGTQYAVYLRLKALPFSTPFGIGTRGQAIGGGLGF